MGPPPCMFLLFMICSAKELRRVLLSFRIQNRPGAGSTFRSSGRSSISTWSRKSFQEPEACSAWAGFGLRCSWLIGCFRCFQVAIENHIGDLRRLGRFGSLKYVTSTNLILGPFWSEITQNVLPRISDKIIEMGLPNSSANVQCSSQHHSLACYYWGTQKCWCTGYTFTFKHVNPSKFDLSLWSCYSAKANCRPWTGRVWLKPFSDAWNLGRMYQVFLKQCCGIVLCQNAYCILWPYRRVHSARSAHRAHRAHRSMLVMVYPTVRVFERLGSQRLNPSHGCQCGLPGFRTEEGSNTRCHPDLRRRNWPLGSLGRRLNFLIKSAQRKVESSLCFSTAMRGNETIDAIGSSWE